jgi:uncharacterized protein YndB with AHSA1/START domain
VNENEYELLPDIVRTVIMDAPIQRIWKAVATSEGLTAWLMKNNFKPVMGYEFTFQATPFGDWDGIVHCEVKELDPPNRLGFTWCGNNMEQYVTFELIEQENNKTQFKLVHSGWAMEHSMLREKMYIGWGYLTEGLQKKLGDKNEGYLS